MEGREFYDRFGSLPKELQLDIWKRVHWGKHEEWTCFVDTVEMVCQDLSEIVRYDLGNGDEAEVVVAALMHLIKDFKTTFMISTPCSHLYRILMGFRVPFFVDFEEEEEPDIQFVVEGGSSRDYIVGDSEAEDWETFDIIISSGGAYVCVTYYHHVWEDMLSDLIRMICIFKRISNEN